MIFLVFCMVIMQFGMIIWYLNDIFCVFTCVFGMLGSICIIWEHSCLHFGWCVLFFDDFLVFGMVHWSVGPLVTFFTPSNAHDISATKRATGDPLVSKRPDFRGLFGFSKKIWNFGFLDFWISGFFGFLAISWQRKELPVIRWCQNDRIFEGFLDLKKKYEFFDF